MKLLIVEDEEELVDSIAEGLRLSGYVVDTASDGAKADELCFINDYDLIVLDVNLPKINGFDLLRKIRQRDKQVNIIMLTARTDIQDRVAGLDLGANDYLTKPFYFAELEARIRSLLRRKQVQEDAVIRYKDLSYDTGQHQAYVNGDQIHLTVKETGILEYLLLNRGSYVSQEELLAHVWGDEIDELTNTVRVHVSALRAKLKQTLGENIIRNKIGRGYIID